MELPKPLSLTDQMRALLAPDEFDALTRFLDGQELTHIRMEEWRQSKKRKMPTLQPKLENETEAEYIARLSAEYKAKMSANAPPALIARAVSFVQAMASKVFEVPASEALQAERLEVCFACEHFVVAFDAPEQVGHCGACGCGKSKMTSLPEKAKILKSTCPKNLWDVTIDPAAVALPIAPPPQS